MSFIRPQAKAVITQNKGYILAACIVLFGAYIMLTTFGLGRVAGGVVLAMGALVAHDTWRRARFPTGTGGLGVVEIDERRLTYFAGHGGGSISMDTLQRAEIHRNGRGHITWVFYDDDGMVEVPGDATGTDQLFDALTALPGVNYDQVDAATKGQGPDLFLIWARDRKSLH